MEIATRVTGNLAALSDFALAPALKRCRMLHSDDGRTLESRPCSRIALLFSRICSCCFSNGNAIARAISFTAENSNIVQVNDLLLLEARNGIGRFMRYYPELFSLLNRAHKIMSREINRLEENLGRNLLNVGQAKMLKNLEKAIHEHQKRGDGYITPEDFLLAAGPVKAPLDYKCFRSEDIGKNRARMEDVHFVQRIEEGTILGVLDGHAGNDVAKFVREICLIRFPGVIRQCGADLFLAMRMINAVINEEINKNVSLLGGCAAVISFIENATSMIYTATLGDCEANIYRVVRRKMRSIPLSPIRDWSYPKEAQRAADFHRMPNIAQIWPRSYPKSLYSNLFHLGVNVSRAFGDNRFGGTFDKPLVIHKAKITMAQLMPGDILILACDGLKDYLTEPEIIKEIQHPSSNNIKLSRRLIEKAKSNMPKEFYHNGEKKGVGYGDNITVIALKFSL